MTILNNGDAEERLQQRLPYVKQKRSFREFQINEKTMKRAFFSSGGTASPSQLAFIKNLAAEKGVKEIFKATGIAVPEESIPTKQEAIAIIEKLIQLRD